MVSFENKTAIAIVTAPKNVYLLIDKNYVLLIVIIEVEINNRRSLCRKTID